MRKKIILTPFVDRNAGGTLWQPLPTYAPLSAKTGVSYLNTAFQGTGSSAALGTKLWNPSTKVKRYVGDGYTTAFAYDWYLPDATYIGVYLNGTKQTLNTNYTVTTNFVIFNSPPPANDGTIPGNPVFISLVSESLATDLIVIDYNSGGILRAKASAGPLSQFSIANPTVIGMDVALEKPTPPSAGWIMVDKHVSIADPMTMEVSLTPSELQFAFPNTPQSPLNNWNYSPVAGYSLPYIDCDVIVTQSYTLAELQPPAVPPPLYVYYVELEIYVNYSYVYPGGSPVDPKKVPPLKMRSFNPAKYYEPSPGGRILQPARSFKPIGTG